MLLIVATTPAAYVYILLPRFAAAGFAEFFFTLDAERIARYMARYAMLLPRRVTLLLWRDAAMLFTLCAMRAAPRTCKSAQRAHGARVVDALLFSRQAPCQCA